MKKVFTLVWSVLALLMVANTTKAQDNYTLYFGDGASGGWSLYTDAEFTTEYEGNSGKWSAAEKVLTLKGFTFETSAAKALVMPKASTLTLAEGSVNTIKNIAKTGTSGIYAYGSLDDDTFTINGSGSLEVSVGNETEGSDSDISAIHIQYGKLCIDGANLTAKAFDSAGGNSEGIGGGATGVEIKNGAIVTASAGRSASYPYFNAGIFVANSGSGLTVTNDCVVKAQGRTYAVNCIGSIPDPINIPVYASTNYNGTGASLGVVRIYEYMGTSEYMITNDNALWVQIGGTLPVDYTLYFGEMDDDDGRWSLFKSSTLIAANEYTENTGTWSAEANKLILNGFTFETTATKALKLPSGKTTIEVTKNTTNTITVNGSTKATGIEGYVVTIQGGGTLNVNATGTETVQGILLTESLQSEITEATVNVSASSGTIVNKALQATAGSLVINNGGILHADGSNSDYGIGIDINSIQMGTASGTDATTMGSLSAQGGITAIFAPNGVTPLQDGFVYSSGSYDGSDAIPKDATKNASHWINVFIKYMKMEPNPAAPTTPDYTLYFGNGSLWKNESLSDEYTENTDKWSASENELTLDGLSFETTANRALVLMANTTITLIGTNSFTSNGTSTEEACSAIDTNGSDLTIIGEENGKLIATSGDGIKRRNGILASGKNISIEGHAIVTVSAGNSETESSYGISTTGFNIQDNAIVTVSAGTATYGTSFGVFAGGKLTLTGGKLTAKSGDAGNSMAISILNAAEGVTVIGGENEGDENALIFDNGAYLIEGTSTEAKYAVMTPTTSTTDETLYFGEGTEDGWSLYTDEDLEIPYTQNTHTWVATENKLTLIGFSHQTTAQYALVLLAKDVTLSLADGTTNTISSTYDGSFDTVGIFAAIGNLTITGNTGILNATVSNTEDTGDNFNYAINVEGSFTLEGGVVNATGSKNGLRTVKDGLVSGGKLTAIGKNCGLSYNSNFTVSGNGEIHAVGNEYTAIAGLFETTGIATGNLTGKPTDPLKEVTWHLGAYKIDDTWAQYVKVTGDKPGGEETGTYHTITLDIAAGIELNNMTAGNHSVEEGSHLHLQFLPEDRTLGAADILFLVDGVETAFTELGENNYFSYILNPVTADHTILVALKEYPVILPEVEGVTYDVGAGTHRVGYGEKFTFSLTLADGIDPEKVHVYANGREILPDALRSVVLTYTIDKVLTPITVVIEGAGDPITGNGNIAMGDIQLRIMNYELQIENTTAQAVDVNVYTVQGKNIVQLRGLRGSKTVRLQPGIYIVKAGSEVFKVSVN